MYCSECGHQVQENAKFCSSCGTEVKNGKTTKSQNSMNSNSEYISNHGQQPKKAKSPFIIISTIVIIAIGGLLLYFSSISGSEVTTPNLNAPEQAENVNQASQPPTITNGDLATLFPGWEIGEATEVNINSSYYTLQEIAKVEDEYTAYVKIAILKYNDETTEWSNVWETDEYPVEAMLGIENYIGDLYVLNPQDEDMALVGFNMLNGGNSGVYATTVFELNNQGQGTVIWEDHGLHIESMNEEIIVTYLGETHFTIENGQANVKEIQRSELATNRATKAEFTLTNGVVVPVNHRDIYVTVGETLSFVPADDETKQLFDNGSISIYTNLWNGGPVSTANVNRLSSGNEITFTEPGTVEFILDYYNPDNFIMDPPVTFFVHVE